MAWIEYLAVFLSTGLLVFIFRPIALSVGLVDIPGGRKTHLHTTPLVGGLAIFFGLVSVSIFLPNILAEYSSLLSLSALVLFIGTIDDFKDLRVAVRMIGHVLVALVMAVVAGVQLQDFGNIFSDEPIDLAVLTLPVTVFATVGVINAINMSDGVDGLSGSLTIVALGSITILALASGDYVTASFITLLICSILAFLTTNFRRPWLHKALVYLGDGGSTMLGFMLAWLLIESTQGAQPAFPPVFALWFLAVPLFDTVNLLIKRPLKRRSPFSPGTDHLHHMLLSRGFSVTQVVFLLLTIALICAGIGLLGIAMAVSESTMFLLFITLFTLYFIFSDRIYCNPEEQ